VAIRAETFTAAPYLGPEYGTGNVSDRAIRDQMRVLNAGYGGFEGGYATGFSFNLAGVTRTVNADWYYAGPTTSAERAMKRALHQGGAEDLNVYFTTAGPYPHRRGRRQRAALRARTPAPILGSTRSTTTWTTRTTRATSSSPPGRPRASRTPGCTTALPEPLM
jgi:hypothetical protein